MSLTNLESRFLVSMYFIGCEGMGGESIDDLEGDNFSWSEAKEIADATGMKLNAVKGVSGSLTKKGMISSDKEGVNGNGVELFCLEPLGFKALREIEEGEGDINKFDIRAGEEDEPKQAPKAKAAEDKKEKQAPKADETEADRVFKQIRENNNVLSRNGKPKQKPNKVAVSIWLETGGEFEAFVKKMAAAKNKPEDKAKLDWRACAAYLGDK